jgi:hypothetical protein
MQPASRLGAAQEVTIGAASAASTAFGAQTYQIRVAATIGCRIKVGDGTPTAAATDAYLPANQAEYLSCTPGQKIAVIQETTGGKLSVTEIA